MHRVFIIIILLVSLTAKAQHELAAGTGYTYFHYPKMDNMYNFKLTYSYQIKGFYAKLNADINPFHYFEIRQRYFLLCGYSTNEARGFRFRVGTGIYAINSSPKAGKEPNEDHEYGFVADYYYYFPVVESEILKMFGKRRRIGFGVNFSSNMEYLMPKLHERDHDAVSIPISLCSIMSYLF